MKKKRRPSNMVKKEKLIKRRERERRGKEKRRVTVRVKECMREPYQPKNIECFLKG